MESDGTRPPASSDPRAAAPTPGNSAPASPASPATGGTPAPGSQRAKYWAPLEVSLNGTCFRRGDTIEVQARSVPYSDFAFTVGYSQPPEGQPKLPPDFTYVDGEANSEGEVTWRVVVRPTVTYGPAVFKTVVKTPEGKGANDSKDLVIARACP